MAAGRGKRGSHAKKKGVSGRAPSSQQREPAVPKAPSGDAKQARPKPSKQRQPLAPEPTAKAQGKRKQPSPEALARAKQRLSPPPAPWHPLPLAELAIFIGFLAILLAAVLADRDGVLAGFILIMIGTAEFSWREHRHGYRPHATVLALIAGFVVGTVCWRVVGIDRNPSMGVGVLVFLFAWGSFDRAYVPAARRESEAAAAAAADSDPPPRKP
ncbi:MAG: hypothetical protein JHD16_03950 [Solirubrobacteraceae bacterium]|nr:hypothetical protein [Solirubrobacteraceae bacterium]